MDEQAEKNCNGMQIKYYMYKCINRYLLWNNKMHKPQLSATEVAGTNTLIDKDCGGWN